MSTQNPTPSTEKTPLSTEATALSTATELLPLEKRALEFLSTEAMLKKGDSVVATVSGGCDSAAMLHILCALSTELDLHILCAHVNHNLRGAESDGDEKFVLKMCEKLGVPCKVYSAPVAEYALEHRLSTEEAGRRLRYEFFEHCADALGADAKIATAHSLSDCAETFIVYIFAGFRDGIFQPQQRAFKRGVYLPQCGNYVVTDFVAGIIIGKVGAVRNKANALLGAILLKLRPGKADYGADYSAALFRNPANARKSRAARSVENKGGGRAAMPQKCSPSFRMRCKAPLPCLFLRNTASPSIITECAVCATAFAAAIFSGSLQKMNIFAKKTA